jgi:hypothetical protein
MFDVTIPATSDQYDKTDQTEHYFSNHRTNLDSHQYALTLLEKLRRTRRRFGRFRSGLRAVCQHDDEPPSLFGVKDLVTLFLDTFVQLGQQSAC